MSDNSADSDFEVTAMLRDVGDVPDDLFESMLAVAADPSTPLAASSLIPGIVDETTGDSHGDEEADVIDEEEGGDVTVVASDDDFGADSGLDDFDMI